nr:mitochondrial genome maintenance exonuclease 1 isoform X2 [Pelodiscus sinensis]|eukprot:XP_025038158.1 mitochondrial genome maintenance exonuclease 1 isoform X2 [Pelodiscus sinensis]
MLLLRMKYFRLLTRKSGRLKMLLTEHFCKNQVPCVCLYVSSYLCSKKKKENGYEQVDQERYTNLVRSVTSFKTSPRTPETLFEEDDLMYGPAFYLERWKQRMILELGNDGFAEYTKNLFLQGKLFHAALESVFLSDQIPLKEQERDSTVSGYLASVQHVLRDISGVKALESAVHHETLHYSGLVDCVAEYRSQLCVIEWKTSERSKPYLQNTFDNPLQVAAYTGAINHDANYDFQVNCGLIVVAYKDGSSAHPHFMDLDLCSRYWNKWLLRLEEYTKKEKNKNISETSQTSPL